jgi:hypothetical protein
MKPQVRIIEDQKEEVKDERFLTEEETKAFLYKNYPEMYKKIYPDEVIEKPKPNNEPNPKPHQKRVDQDIQKSNKVYTYNKYGTENLGTDQFNYNIQIKSDMNINQ